MDDSKLTDLFNIWDRDGNGFIDRDEIKATMGSLCGGHVSNSEVDEMLDEADLNKDQKIDPGEFITVMKKHRDA